MYRCLVEHEADAVLGPVLPAFPACAPLWLKKSGLCERNRSETGSPITRNDMRTGNIMIVRYLFEEDTRWFDPSRGRTGGEDGEFISRHIKAGKKFVWCDEGIVFETVPQDRWHSGFYLNRAYRIGSVSGSARRRSESIGSAIRPSILLVFYAGLTPFSLVFGKHIWMKVLTKLVYNIGFISSFSGLTAPRFRENFRPH
jgi:hypothetical protein